MLKSVHGPASCSSVGWALSRKAKGHRLDFQSGHIPRLWVWSLDVSLSHNDVSLPHFPSLSLKEKKSKHMKSALQKPSLKVFIVLLSLVFFYLIYLL